jgi:uncharacterized damage-inducible protein DinB
VGAVVPGDAYDQTALRSKERSGLSGRADAKWKQKVAYAMLDVGRHTPQYTVVVNLLHVVHHGTLHGGQCGRAAATGSVPPQTDILFYYREPEAPGAGIQHQLLRDC